MSTTGAYSASGADATRDRRHPAQLYCLAAGVSLLLAGAFGFIADATFDTGNQIQGDSFLGFEVNGWHNLVHIASGLVLLAAASRRGLARSVALGFGVVYGIVTLIGLIDGNTVLSVIPINPADNVLHLGLSVLGIAAGLLPDRDRSRARQASTRSDRPAASSRAR
jgi:hypothetical protein